MISSLSRIRKRISKQLLLKHRLRFVLFSISDFFNNAAVKNHIDVVKNRRLLRSTSNTASEANDLALFRSLSYARDQLWVDRISLDWMEEPMFQRAYERGTADLTERYGPSLFEWRFHVLIGLAHYARSIRGDFVELGVHEGYYAMTLKEWFHENPAHGRYYLLDSFCGLSPAVSDTEEVDAAKDVYTRFSKDRLQRISSSFPESERYVVIQGWLPETIDQIDSQKIAFLSVDLNAAQAEYLSLKRIWPKLAPGCVVVLDDYGRNRKQRIVADQFAREHDEFIITLPTGQGVFFKLRNL